MIGIDLTDRTAVVTGGSQGIGAATVTRLHEAGANVVINYVSDANRDNAEQLRNGLTDRAITFDADVCEIAQIEAMFEAAVKRFGGVDIVVNNAGIIRDRALKNMADDEWMSVINTNLTGVFHVCKAAEPLLADGGRIVNIASIAGLVGFYGQCNYAAAKAGVMGLTRVLSKELARRRITVNAIAPGVIHTPMEKTLPDHVRAKMLESIPLGQFGQPDDIAYLITYLCSDMARYITGQVLEVNGGWHG